MAQDPIDTPVPAPVEVPSAATAGGEAAPSPLARRALVAYSIPMAAFMAVTMPISMYLMKFSVDVLAISPAAMGLILGFSRIWDAVTDPVAGYYSDRTRSRLGRRRTWMAASIVPVALSLWMVWSPPLGLEGLGLVLFMAMALLLYETASTAFIVPYTALGMELSSAYHERTRLFAWRHLIGSTGFAVGMGLVYTLRTAEDARAAGQWLVIASSAFVAVAVLWAVVELREPAAHAGRGGLRIRGAFADVFRNPHARLLFLVYAIEAFGASSISALAPFVMEYVVKKPDLLEIFVVSFVLPQFALTPLWIRLARRWGKRRLWLLGMIPLILGFAGMMALEEGSTWLPLGLVALIGVGSGIASVVAPAIQADVIDYDELQTGERKEGSYTAVWNFIRKAGWGVAMLFTGFLLEFSGYEAGAEQSASVQRTILILIGLVPALGYTAGTLLLSRFRLDEAQHREIRDRLAGSASGRGSPEG